MRELRIEPMSQELLDDAASLLARRHERHVEAEPLLPADVDYRAEIDKLWNADGASGTVAIRNGQIAGYLLGVRRDETWGPNVWIELAGHAVEEPELVRDLYSVAATRWVDEGRTRHYALVPATDEALLDAWFRLSFGAQHAAGIQETPPGASSSPDGVVVRRAEDRDAEAAVELDLELPRHQALAPVFAAGPPWTKEESRDEFFKDIADPQTGLFVAELDGAVVGMLAMCPLERSSMHTGLARPERTAFLAFAATLPKSRGSGAGLALTNAGFDWAREHGYPVIVTDWRETNLLSSRFWPARGFRRTFRRLYRSIP